MVPKPTTGLNIAARVRITSSAPTLVLVGASQSLTYQITAEVTDVDNNLLDPQPDLYYATNDDSIATVSDDGLVTAVGAGVVNVTVATPAFGNAISLWQVNGLPWNSVEAEQSLQVVQGTPILPDFSFTLDSSDYTVSANGTFSITITQTAYDGFTGDVSYVLLSNYPLSRAGAFVPGLPSPSLGYRVYTPFGAGQPTNIVGNISGTITGGSGTLVLNLTAVDAPASVMPLVISANYPIWGATGADGGGPIRSHNVSSSLTVTA
jgi:hypothetical protein